MSGRTALPASVIRPSLSSLRQRALLSSVHLGPLRGENLWTVPSSGSLRTVESIQPKHRASSTASTYGRMPVGSFVLSTATQQPLEDRWFSSSQDLNPARSRMRTSDSVILSPA